MSGGSLMENIRITDMHAPVQTEAMKRILADLEGVEISLEKQVVLDLAEQQLDVEIDIDDGLLDRFAAVFGEAVASAPMHQLGRLMLQQLVVGGIVQNSRMNAIRRQHPEIAQTPIKAPLVVAGMPRSGTTYLLQLLASEQDFTALTQWESTTPFPSQKMLRGEEEDTRIALGQAALDLLSDISPYHDLLYDVGVEEHTEEIGLMVLSCYMVGMSFFGDLPKYDKALYGGDQRPAYEHMRDTLQTLSWLKKAKPTDRWLLKSPQHMGGLPALDAVFPDAKLVFTHRDPASVFTSLLTLTGYSVRRFFSGMSKQQLVDRAKRMQHGFLRGIIAHADRFEGRAEHIYFSQFMNDYHESVERVFALIDKPYDDARRAAVQRQAEAHQRGRKGARVVYDLEADFGITRDEIRQEFAYYIDKYDVEIEETQK